MKRQAGWGAEGLLRERLVKGGGTCCLLWGAALPRTVLIRSPSVSLSVVSEDKNPGQLIVPFTKSGIDPPVRNPAQSFVNELQLKSMKARYGGRYGHGGRT